MPAPRGDAAPGDRIDLWYVFEERAGLPGLLRRYRSLLAPEEVERQARLVRERDRRLFLISRALVRTTLSRYAPVDPGAWRFAAGEQGKPEIVAPSDLPPLRFNLTHTPGLVACAVAPGHEVGVDAERRDRPVACLDLARRAFSAEERTQLEALPEQRRRERFFELWTLREAYVKARGEGMLRVPRDAVTFRLSPDAGAQASFDATWPDDPSRWRFFRVRPAESHRCAVAVRSARPADLVLSVWETVPLADQDTDRDRSHSRLK
jgi:4'-phosphopantetheinyl transferase